MGTVENDGEVKLEKRDYPEKPKNSSIAHYNFPPPHGGVEKPGQDSGFSNVYNFLWYGGALKLHSKSPVVNLAERYETRLANK